MKYICNEGKAIFFHNDFSERVARYLIGGDGPVQEGTAWESYNIIPDREAYQILDYEGSEEDPDPIWYAYQVLDGCVDEGRYDFERALQDARSSDTKEIYAIGIRQNFLYKIYDIEKDEWEY